VRLGSSATLSLAVTIHLHSYDRSLGEFLRHHPQRERFGAGFLFANRHGDEQRNLRRYFLRKRSFGIAEGPVEHLEARIDHVKLVLAFQRRRITDLLQNFDWFVMIPIFAFGVGTVRPSGEHIEEVYPVGSFGKKRRGYTLVNLRARVARVKVAVEAGSAKNEIHAGINLQAGQRRAEGLDGEIVEQMEKVADL
jgi:hypothetical protein